METTAMTTTTTGDKGNDEGQWKTTMETTNGDFDGDNEPRLLNVPGRPNTLSTYKRAVKAIKLCTAMDMCGPPICGHQMDCLPVLITSAKSNYLS